MLDRADGNAVAVADRRAQAGIDDIVAMRLDLDIRVEIRAAKNDARGRRGRTQGEKYFTARMQADSRGPDDVL